MWTNINKGCFLFVSLFVLVGAWFKKKKQRIQLQIAIPPKCTPPQSPPSPSPSPCLSLHLPIHVPRSSPHSSSSSFHRWAHCACSISQQPRCVGVIPAVPGRAVASPTACFHLPLLAPRSGNPTTCSPSPSPPPPPALFLHFTS